MIFQNRFNPAKLFKKILIQPKPTSSKAALSYDKNFIRQQLWNNGSKIIPYMIFPEDTSMLCINL